MRRAVGDRRQPQVDADRRGVMHVERNHAGRHALAAHRRQPAQLIDQGRALLLAVQQQRGLLPAGLRIGGKHGFQAQPHVRRARIRIRQRAGRTDRGAGAATGAQMGIDLDLIAVMADRFCRADVDARMAADLGIAAVRAQLFLVAEEFRLLELADHLQQLERSFKLPRSVGAGSEIALRRRMQRDQRGVGQVEDQIEFAAAPGRAARKIDRGNRLRRR